MKPTRIIALLLALVMLLGVFASCDLIKDHEDDIDEIIDPGTGSGDGAGDGSGDGGDGGSGGGGNGGSGDGGSGSGGSGGSGGGGSATGCEHFWILGVCRLCSTVCSHEWGDGICKKCDCPCGHTQQQEHKEDRCSVCREEYTRISYNVSVLSEGATRPTQYTMDIAMSIDELCAHFIPTWIYIFRHKVLDIKVNGEAVSDFTKVINSDIELKYTAKSDALRVTVTDGTVANSQEIILPAEGVTMGLFGALLYPTSGGFDHLLQVATVVVDDVTVTNASYKVDKNCVVYVIPKSGTGGGSTPPPAGDEKKEIHVTFENLVTGEYYEGKPEAGIKLDDAFKEICGLSLEYLFENGIVYLNGEQIYESMPLEDHSSIQFAEVQEGHVVISFNGTADLGVGETVNKRVIVERNCTFESVVLKMLDMSWEEYENSFYNTRITGEGDYTTWIPVYRDTKIYDSLTIFAIKYKPHEKTENVTLTININGIINDSVTVPYDTLISEAFGRFTPPLDFEKCLEEWDMFFNVYALVSDAKLKYNSFIYGSKPCNGHVWADGKCTECGASCTYTYYEGKCPICGGEHPSSRPEGTYVKISIYEFDIDGNETNSTEIEVLEGTSIEEIAAKFWGKLEDVLKNGTLTVDEKKVSLDDKICLYGGEKIVYKYGIPTNCTHDFERGVCRICEFVCPHEEKVNNVCTLCSERFVTITFYDKKGDKVTDGPTIYVVIYETSSYGFVSEYLERNSMAVENGYLFVNGERVYYYDFREDCEVWYVEPCKHNYENGICKDCTHPCDHYFKSPLESTVCGSCGINLIPLRPTCEHSWRESNMCHRCGIQSSEVEHFTVKYYRYRSSDAYGKKDYSTSSEYSAPIYSTLGEILRYFGHHAYLPTALSVYVNGVKVTGSDIKYTSDITVEVIISQYECKHGFDATHSEPTCFYCGYKCPHESWESASCKTCGKHCNHEIDYDRCVICGYMPDHPAEVIYEERYLLTYVQATLESVMKSYGIDYDEAVKNGYFACLINEEYIKMEKDDKLIKFYRSDIIHIVFITT